MEIFEKETGKQRKSHKNFAPKADARAASVRKKLRSAAKPAQRKKYADLYFILA